MAIHVSRRELLQATGTASLLGLAGCLTTSTPSVPRDPDPGAVDAPGVDDDTSSPSSDESPTAEPTTPEDNSSAPAETPTPDNESDSVDGATPIEEPTTPPTDAPGAPGGGSAPGGGGGYAVTGPYGTIHSVTCSGATISAWNIENTPGYPLEFEDHRVDIRIVYSDPNPDPDHVGATSWLRTIGPVITDENGRLDTEFVSFGSFGFDPAGMRIDHVMLGVALGGSSFSAIGASWTRAVSC